MKWKCDVCGYIHAGTQPPFVCPQCQAPAIEFYDMDEEPKLESVLDKQPEDLESDD